MIRQLAFMVLMAAPSFAAAQVIAVDPSKIPPRPVSPRPSTGIRTEAVGAPIVAPASILVLGQGYNALTGDFLTEVCVDKTVPDQTFGAKQVGGAFSHEYIDSVSDMSTHDSASGSSAGFDFTYKLVSVGFDTGSTSSGYYNKVDQFARIYKRLVTRGEARIGGMWSGVGSTYIQRTTRAFTQKCGTHFVRAIYYGHLIDQTVRFTLSQSKYGSTDRNGFSVGVSKLFGFNYSDTASQTTVNNDSSLVTIDDSRGLINAIPAPKDGGGVQTIVQYAREKFPVAVAASPTDQGSILLVELVPYYQLAAPGSAKVPAWPDEIEASIQAKGPLYEQFSSALSDLNFAIALPDTARAKAYAETKPQLLAKLQLATGYQANFRAAAKTCYDLLVAGVDDNKARVACEQKLNGALDATMVSAITPTLAP